MLLDDIGVTLVDAGLTSCMKLFSDFSKLNFEKVACFIILKISKDYPFELIPMCQLSKKFNCKQMPVQEYLNMYSI